LSTLSELLRLSKLHPAIAAAIVGAAIGAVLTKLIPAVYDWCAGSLRWVGRLLGGRFAYAGFQKRYLDWVVTEQSELRLTGIVSTDESKRPKLEQVFVSLHVGSNWAVTETAAWDPVTAAFLRTWVDILELFSMCAAKPSWRKLPPGFRKLRVEARELAGSTLSARVSRLRRRLTRAVEVAPSVAPSEWAQQHFAELEKHLPDYILYRLLRDRDRIAILGAPGAGKSTLLQYVALAFAREKTGDPKLKRRGVTRERLGRQDWKIPIFIRLSAVASALSSSDQSGAPSLTDVIPSVLPPDLQRDPAAKSYFIRALKRGRCVVLLDGLDEVPSETEFKAVARAIQSAVVTFGDNQFIVTSRLAGWRGGIGSDFDVFYVNDLVDRQVNLFIETWYASVERNSVVGRLQDEGNAERKARERRAEQRAQELKSTLRENPGIRRLASNPMLLSIIALVHRSLAMLPRERTKLYAQCSKILLEQWDMSRGVRVDDTNLKLPQKEKLMQRLAFALHVGEIGDPTGGREAPARAVEELIAAELPALGKSADEAAHLLQMLVERSGILLERQRGVLSFAHLTFQEYFTAKHLVGRNDSAYDSFLLRKDRMESDWWREVILLYSGLLADTSEFVRGVYVDNDDLCRTRLRLAAMCVGEAVSIADLSIRDQITAELYAIRSGSPLSSQLAREMAEYLVWWARSEQWYAAAALNTISRTTDRSLIVRQILAGLSDRNSLVRGAALKVTTICDWPLPDDVVFQAVSCLQRGDVDEKHAAVEALRQVAKRASGVSLRNALRALALGSDVATASAAAEVLAEYRQPLDRIEDISWPKLARLPGRTAQTLLFKQLLQLAEQDRMSVTRSTLRDLVMAQRRVRHDTTWALDLRRAGKQENRHLDIVLSELLLTDNVESVVDVADAVVKSVRTHKDWNISDLALELAGQTDSAARLVALRLLRSRPDGKFLPAIVNVVGSLLDDKDAPVRNAAISTITVMRSGARTRFGGKIIAMTRDSDADVRLTAVRSLRLLTHTDWRSSAIDACRLVMGEKRFDLALTAASSLAVLGGKREIPRLRETLRTLMRRARPARRSIFSRWQVVDPRVVADIADVVRTVRDVEMLDDLFAIAITAVDYSSYMIRYEEADVDSLRVELAWQISHLRTRYFLHGRSLGALNNYDAVPVAEAVADAARALPWSDVEPRVTRLLENDDVVIRQLGLSILGKLGDMRLSDTLLTAYAQCFRARASSTRAEAVRSVRHLAAATVRASVMPLLLTALGDDVPLVRSEAWESVVYLRE